MKVKESGSISQRHGSPDPDPDPHHNAMDPQHCLQAWVKEHRTLVKEETGGKLTTQELAKELARRWKALDKQEKSSYKVGRAVFCPVLRSLLSVVRKKYEKAYFFCILEVPEEFGRFRIRIRTKMSRIRNNALYIHEQCRQGIYLLFVISTIL